jgi:hypothetical protein
VSTVLIHSLEYSRSSRYSELMVRVWVAYLKAQQPTAAKNKV